MKDTAHVTIREMYLILAIIFLMEHNQKDTLNKITDPQ
jgi:hypothetical protein